MSPGLEEIQARIIQCDQNLTRLERKRELRGGELNEADRAQVVMLQRRRAELRSLYEALAEREGNEE